MQVSAGASFAAEGYRLRDIDRTQPAVNRRGHKHLHKANDQDVTESF
jgi:hypothetical protein